LPNKNRRIAVEVALDRLRPVASCVTDRPVIASGYRKVPSEVAAAEALAGGCS